MRYNMKLEDFFTVEELEYGLTNPARVEELVNAMLEEVDCTVENASEASRPWLGVANVISATNNKSCLDIFINRDGSLLMGKWLKHAIKFVEGNSASSFSDLVISLLEALGKLHNDSEKTISPEISDAVQGLLWHECSAIQDSARALLKTWKIDEDGPKSTGEGEGASSEAPHTEEEKSDSPKIGEDVSERMEYGLIDALEVACKVAKDVEREVVDSDGPYCSSSSSEKSVQLEHGQDPGSPDSVSGPGRSPNRESSLVTEADAEKTLCDFDLNQEIILDDFKEKSDVLGIDLNVADNADRVIPFVELGIDLNRVSDDFDDGREQAWIYSPASSSSSVPHPREIDLNGPSLSSDHGSNLGEYSFGSYVDKPADCVISLMGKKVVVGPPCNGTSTDFGVGTSKTGGSWGFGFAAAPYSYPYYDMNGVTPSGAFPYMVDSRGVPVVPQIMPFHKSHPYFPNAVTTLGIGPSHFHTVDLNSSFEDGVREPPFLRQLLINGDARMVDEHLVLNAQPGLGSGIREKRNEPAGGWDPYPFPTKRQLPPWR